MGNEPPRSDQDPSGNPDTTEEEQSNEDDAPENVPQENSQPEGEEGGLDDKPEPTRYGDWEIDGRVTDF